EGVVLDGADRPVPGVGVTALQGDQTHNSITDTQGRFSFAVRHGTVRLLARKDGYAGNRDGVLITVSPGQQLRGVTLRIVAGAGVTGAVLDARRKPVPYAHALLMRYAYDDAGLRDL